MKGIGAWVLRGVWGGSGDEGVRACAGGEHRVRELGVLGVPGRGSGARVWEVMAQEGSERGCVAQLQCAV